MDNRSPSSAENKHILVTAHWNASICQHCLIESVASYLQPLLRCPSGMQIKRTLRFSRTVLGKRLAAAQAMLQSAAYRESAIASIAYECGFKDPAHFSKLFKARYVMSPSRCRASSQEIPQSCSAQTRLTRSNARSST